MPRIDPATEAETVSNFPSWKTRHRSDTVWIGVDPGASGGLAAVWEDSTIPTEVQPLKGMTERDIWEWFQGFIGLNVRAVIEQVGGYIKGSGSGKDRTGGGQPGSAAFKFGMSYGALRMALIAANIPFEAVAPRTWQKTIGISPRKTTEGRTQWKNRLKGRAQELHPSVKITLAVADALLIATFCLRRNQK